MILLGRTQTLTIQKKTDFGVYLVQNAGNEVTFEYNDDEKLSTDSILLPKAQVPEGLQTNDTIEVFVYKDSEDRPIATTTKPLLELGGLARLKVKDIGNIGAFLEWGLAKDLFLPFKQQVFRVRKGDEVLVGMYIDKSQRLCATMKVYPYLKKESPYQKDDRVVGTVYEVIEAFGAFVVVDDAYSALIPNKELHRAITPGTIINARVAVKQPDGRLTLSLNDKIPVQMSTDGQLIIDKLLQADGYLPYNDSSNAEDIAKEFGISKNAFKRAIGHLMKEKQISIDEDGIRSITHH